MNWTKIVKNNRIDDLQDLIDDKEQTRNVQYRGFNDELQNEIEKLKSELSELKNKKSDNDEELRINYKVIEVENKDGYDFFEFNEIDSKSLAIDKLKLEDFFKDIFKKYNNKCCYIKIVIDEDQGIPYYFGVNKNNILDFHKIEDVLSFVKNNARRKWWFNKRSK